MIGKNTHKKRREQRKSSIPLGTPKDSGLVVLFPLKRKIEKNNSLFIYTSEVLINLTNSLEITKTQKVKLLHLFSKIYYFQFVFRREDKERIKDGAPICSQTMREIYGTRDYNFIRDILEAKGFISSNHEFSESKGLAKRFKALNQGILPALLICKGKLWNSLKTPPHETVTPPPTWLATPEARETYEKRRDFLLSVQGKLSLKADWENLSLDDPERKSGVYASAEDLTRGHFYAKTAESGRWFHFLTSCRRELRQKILINGEQTCELDITAAQPSIISSFYPGPCEEKDKYLAVIQSGKFYEYVAALVGTDIRADTNRTAFKKECLKQVFYDQNGDNIPSYSILKAFKQEFPQLSEILYQFKQTAGDKLAMHMQKLEAKIVIEGVIDYAIQYAIPVLPVHDSLFFRTRDLPLMQSLLCASFKKAVGFEPLTKTKKCL